MTKPTSSPTRQFVQDHAEHLCRELVEVAAADVALAAGHDGSGRVGPVIAPLELLGLACQRELPNISGGFPRHHRHLWIGCVPKDRANLTWE